MTTSQKFQPVTFQPVKAKARLVEFTPVVTNRLRYEVAEIRPAYLPSYQRWEGWIVGRRRFSPRQQMLTTASVERGHYIR